MKQNRNYYPVLAVTCLAFGALIPMSSGGEEEKSPALKAAQVAKEDKLVHALNAKVIDPLNKQAARYGLFSRRLPTHSITYQLVEKSGNPRTGQRYFSVMVMKTPLSKAKQATSSEFLKLRYIDKNDQVLVQLKGSWVELDEHPILKVLPKTEPTKTSPIASH